MNEFQNNNVNLDNGFNNQNFKPKKYKISLGIVILILVFALICVIAALLYKSNKLPFVDKKVDEDTIVNEDDEYDYRGFVTDYRKLPKDNKYMKMLREFDSLTFGNLQGVLEGIINVKNQELYKVSIDTNNMMLIKVVSQDHIAFGAIDGNNLLNDIHFYSDLELLKDREIIISEVDEIEHTYNGWKYGKIESRADSEVCLYPIYSENRLLTVWVIYIDSMNFKYMSEQQYENFYKKLIDCFEVEYIGKYNSEDEDKYTNTLTYKDLSEKKITEKLVVDMKSNFYIEDYFGNVFDLPDSTSLGYSLISKDLKYSVGLESDKENRIDEFKNSTFPKFIVESRLVNDEETYVVSGEDGIFYYLIIPKDEETVCITLDREEGRDSYFDYDYDFVKVQTEEALEYLEKYLFK